MNAPEKAVVESTAPTPTAAPDLVATGLAILRKPFPPELISKLPKPTAKQTEEVKADRTTGINCPKCGSWHHRNVAHLDYVGHAALTDRLLDADPQWNWEPVSVNPDGTPALDKEGGMWIKLTVCGVTRLGYGDATGKTGANAVKERIGDALRNAAIRFGAALDLWSKVDLHFDEHEETDQQTGEITKTEIKAPQSKSAQQKTPPPADANPAAATDTVSTAEPVVAPAAKAAAPAPAPTLSTGAIVFLRNKAKAAGKDEAALCAEFGVTGTSFDGVTQDQWAAIKAHLIGG